MDMHSLQQMLTQFRQVQERMQQQMEELRVEATAGAGMVTVHMNGHKQLLDVRIEPEVFRTHDQEMLQDLIRAAVNEAARRVDETFADQMKSLAGSLPGVAGLKIPGMF
jgi:hypothetical protein